MSTISGPSSVYVSLACRGWPDIESWLGSCHFLGDPDLYCWKTLYFCDFSGGGGPAPCPPSGSAHASFTLRKFVMVLSRR